MYNAVVNDWKDAEPQITFDVRQPKTHAHSMERRRRFLDEHPYVDVIRFTTVSYTHLDVYKRQTRRCSGPYRQRAPGWNRPKRT